MNLSHKKANKSDLPRLIELLIDDELGSKREGAFEQNRKSYEETFNLIDNDPNQYLMVVLKGNEIVATCHLTLVPSLTYKGKVRCQIEALRVCSNLRSQGIGHWVIREGVNWGKEQGAKIFQLTADKRRERVKKFYESLGFASSHDGYKMHLE